MKSCQVYARRGDLFVVPQARTADGFWISWPPFAKVPQDSPDVGALVLAALDATAHDVPTPNFRTEPMPITPVLALAGVKSWATFVKGAELVAVDLDDGRLSLSPMVNGGSREGFSYPAAERVVRTTEVDADTIGQLLKDLWTASA
ncbi:hypothetical protein [Lentzea sp. NPDC051838]|uniref:hypothetical protein n=1 Tax=Lentzea sp. NPDC051838 TaxID=3154849 RepID=UPI00341C12BA